MRRSHHMLNNKICITASVEILKSNKRKNQNSIYRNLFNDLVRLESYDFDSKFALNFIIRIEFLRHQTPQIKPRPTVHLILRNAIIIYLFADFNHCTLSFCLSKANKSGVSNPIGV